MGRSTITALIIKSVWVYCADYSQNSEIVNPDASGDGTSAEVDGMAVLAEGSEHDRAAFTRSLTPAREPVAPNGAGQTLIVFTLRDIGALPASRSFFTKRAQRFEVMFRQTDVKIPALHHETVKAVGLPQTIETGG